MRDVCEHYFQFVISGEPKECVIQTLYVMCVKCGGTTEGRNLRLDGTLREGVVLDYAEGG